MLRRTREPGLFYDDVTGKWIKIVEWRVDDRYDTEVQASGAVSANTEIKFFAVLTNKKKCDANFPTANRLVGTGEEMIIERLGVSMPSALGNTLALGADVRKALEGFYFLWKMNRDDIAEGVCTKFPSGYGLAGMTQENNAAIVTNGVPSTAATAKLSRTYEVDKDTQIEVIGTWYDHTWDAANMPTTTNKVYFRPSFHGLIKVAATRSG